MTLRLWWHGYAEYDILTMSAVQTEKRNQMLPDITKKTEDKVIKTIKLIKPTTYMSKMGYAWMLATMMAKFPLAVFPERSQLK